MREKLFVGPKVRSLREGQRLTLEACAKQLGLSISYLSQIETNQRPVTARVLLALSRHFAINPGDFDSDEESRMIAVALQKSDNLDKSFPHPIFGPLNLKEWLAFHRIHSMDHIQQIDKIKAGLGYPSA